ncbi:HD-GYP domain-containing protein [Desulfitobacterium sp. Sab5]|uniref:HD-GYP domain-containing protein n=1 Tax=Desulfitobacterium nosdiversum TaxID=3375356 RepID=UPI003CF5E3A6
MQFVLKPVNHRFKGGEFASQDYFDHQGNLLVGKGQVVTPSLASYFNRQPVNSLYYEWPDAANPITEHPDSSILINYPRISPWLSRIFLEMDLFKPQLMLKAISFIDTLLEHLFVHPGISSDFKLLYTSDSVTYRHSINVAFLSFMIGKEFNYKGEKLRRLVFGALLHDIGKLNLPDKILNKPEALTLEEFKIIQSHPTLGVQRTTGLILPESVISTILQHHERWNGTGYPQGLANHEISPSAQIVAVADVYEALITDRPYHAGLPPYHAIEILLKGSETHFSPEVIETFLHTIQFYPADSLVTLNSGETGIVLHYSYPNLTRPRIRIIMDAGGIPVEREWIVDLLQDNSRYILSVKYNRAG